MEDYRCRMVAAETEDLRCKSLLDGAVNEAEDPRYRFLRTRTKIEVEDCRCNAVAMTTEDPRCQGLVSKW